MLLNQEATAVVKKLGADGGGKKCGVRKELTSLTGSVNRYKDDCFCTVHVVRSLNC